MAIEASINEKHVEADRLRQELNAVCRSCLRLAFALLGITSVVTFLTLYFIPEGVLSFSINLFVFMITMHQVYKILKTRRKAKALFVRLERLEQVIGTRSREKTAEPRLFFAWDILSILLPRMTRVTQWVPSHWELKAEFFKTYHSQTSSYRRNVVWITLAIKSLVVWCQCWWNYTPLQIKVGLPIVLSLGLLKYVASMVGL